MPEGFNFAAKFDGIEFDVTDAGVDHGRSVPAHIFPKRDGADLEDSGRNPWVCDMGFIFVDRPTDEAQGAGNYEERFRAFDKLVDLGTARTLIHPYQGEIIVRISNFRHDGDGGARVIRCTATFTEEISLRPTRGGGAGAQTRAGSLEVQQSTVAVEGEVAGLAGILTGTEGQVAGGPVLPTEGAIITQDVLDESAVLTAEATATAVRWESDPDLSARTVQLEMATLNNRLNSNLNDMDAYASIERYPLVREYTRLQHNLRRAAEAFTTTTTRLVEITVTEPTPLRVIAARFYSAAESERRFQELRDLNPELRDPTLVPAGTILKAYSRKVEPRRFV